MSVVTTLDGGARIRRSHVSPIGVIPGADGILAALESATSGVTR